MQEVQEGPAKVATHVLDNENFQVRTLIFPLFDTRPGSISVHARILPFLGTRPDSTIYRYSHSFYRFSVLVRTDFLYSHGFYLFFLQGETEDLIKALA